MNFRRIPFQFSSADPVTRQLELEKRFGLPNRENMYVDVTNPLTGGAGFRESSSAANSPRLQHRVPMFVDGRDELRNAESMASNVDTGRKPSVRVIPIKIEGEESTPRYRTFSGPAGYNQVKPEDYLQSTVKSSTKHSKQEIPHPTKAKLPCGPKIYNIPIQIEGKNDKKSTSLRNVNPTSVEVKKTGACNGCTPSKVKEVNVEVLKETSTVDEKKEPDFTIPLKQIEQIMEEFKSYEEGVQEFTGTIKDKQYRYLDEMLTRCMLRLDDIDTMGKDEIRMARKSAVKRVQACVDLLDTKVNAKIQDNEMLPVELEKSQGTSVEDGEMTAVKESGIVDSEVQETEKNILVQDKEFPLETVHTKIQDREVLLVESEESQKMAVEDNMPDQDKKVTSEENTLVTNKEVPLENESEAEIEMTLDNNTTDMEESTEVTEDLNANSPKLPKESIEIEMMEMTDSQEPGETCEGTIVVEEPEDLEKIDVKITDEDYEVEMIDEEQKQSPCKVDIEMKENADDDLSVTQSDLIDSSRKSDSSSEVTSCKVVKGIEDEQNIAAGNSVSDIDHSVNLQETTITSPSSKTHSQSINVNS